MKRSTCVRILHLCTCNGGRTHISSLVSIHGAWHHWWSFRGAFQWGSISVCAQLQCFPVGSYDQLYVELSLSLSKCWLNFHLGPEQGYTGYFRRCWVFLMTSNEVVVIPKSHDSSAVCFLLHQAIPHLLYSRITGNSYWMETSSSYCIIGWRHQQIQGRSRDGIERLFTL